MRFFRKKEENILSKWINISIEIRNLESH